MKPCEILQRIEPSDILIGDTVQTTIFSVPMRFKVVGIDGNSLRIRTDTYQVSLADITDIMGFRYPNQTKKMLSD